MNDIPWVSRDITGPEEWSQYAEKILRDTDNADIQPSYGDIAGMLECSCPSPEHHEESRALSSPLLPCWFVDPTVKYQFGILSCLKHVRPSEEVWRRLLKPACVELFVVFPSLVTIEGDEDIRRACYFVFKGLDPSNEAARLFLFILDLANLLRLWDWKLSTQEMLRLLTSEWALLEDKHGLGLDQPASFSHPVLDLPLKVKQMRYFIQSLAMDLIYLSYEPPCVILKNLPYLMGQAICPLWNLIRPWPEFVHGNNFLDQFKMVFKRLLECEDFSALPAIQAPNFQANENSPHVAFWRLGEEKFQSGQKCVLCWKTIAESASFLAARSPAKCIYPRDVLVIKPDQPASISTVCSYSCHLAIGDHFKDLTWTDRLREKLYGDGNVDTNGVTFFRIRYKIKNTFPTLTHQAFLNDANWIVTLRHPAKSVFSNSLYKDLTRLLKDRQEKSQPLVQKLLKDKMDFVNGNFLDRDEDLTFLQDELSHLEDFTTVSEDLGSIRCFWQRSWLPVGIFAKDNVDDVLVVSHFVQEHPCHYVGRKQVQEVLELLVLEREFLVLPITQDICDIPDVKMGALFLLRRPKFQNNFSPASLQSGRWYMFARRLDSKTRNCVGGFFMPCPSEANSWIGILVPDMFDRITRVPRLDATVQRLASFQKSNFKVHEIAKASIFISNNSIRRDETNNIKKTVFYVMGLMLHRDACGKGLAPKLDNKVKMIPFKMVLPNANFIDCTIVLNFVFMTGHQFLPVIQHISQKLDWIFRYNFTIEEEKEGPVPKEWIFQEEHFREEKFDRFKINTKFAGAREESHLPRVNRIWSKSTKIVFDGELLVYRMHVFASLRPTFRAIVLHDFVLSDILEMDYFDSLIKPRRERKRWHFFYICGGAKPVDLSGMEDQTIDEIARTVGHIGCHFYVFVTDDVEDVLTDGLAPPRPFPMFSKSHYNHALQNRNHKVLMWTGSLFITMEEHETPFGLSGWLIHEDGNFKNPKYWQTFFQSLHPQTLVFKGGITEFVVQDLIKNSTMFSFSIAPIWAREGSDLGHGCFIDIFRQTIRAIFGDGRKHQYALVVNIPGKEARSGILLRDESGIGCRFYVPNDSKWTQRHFVSFNIPLSTRPLKSKISGSTSFKPNKKCYILGTFKAVLDFHIEVCDIPIYMVAKTYDPNISSDRLNFTNLCDEFTGSHSLVPLFRGEDCTLTSSMKELGFILGSSTASIRAAFQPDLLYCDTMMPRPFDLSYFGALFFFQGSFTELRHHLCHENYPEVAKRSFIAKTDVASEPLTVFLFHFEFMLMIVELLAPPILYSNPLCQCYKKKREFEIFVDIQKNEARRLWEDFDEREQFRRIMKQTKRDKPPKKSKPCNGVMYPGMLELFHEEKSKILANMGNNESDDSCTLEALYQAQEHVRCFAPASSPAEPKIDSDSEIQQKENSVPDSSCPTEFAGKDPPTSSSPNKKSDPKTTEEKPATLISENQREVSISASQETVDQGFPSPLLKPMESIFQHIVSPEARNNVLDEMIHLTWKKLVDNEEPLRVCDNCGREEFDMKVCYTCRASFFCNNKCFKRAQKTHKKMCAQIVNQRLNLVMEVLRQPQLPKL